MGQSQQTDAPLFEGAVIDGRYRLTRRIGRGGFAWVYEGEHVDLGRSAAVKILDIPSHENSAEFAERFLREARIIARLSHPNIVSVYDFGLHADTGQPYIALELLNGHDLEQELATNGPLAPERAKRLFVGAADALRVAHDSGIVHKDLKPSNLFIADPATPSERLVLLDFGIAWATDDSGRLTKDGSFTGTPAYVAPEYARHLQISPAVDVYQLGLILSEGLSCTPCVRGTAPVQLILAHCQGELVIPDQVRASEFGAVVLRATAKDPSMRYTDGGALAAALSDVDASTMVQMKGPTTSAGARTAEHLFSHAESAPTLLERPPSAVDQTPPPAPTAPPLNPAAKPADPLSWPWLAVGAVGLIVIAGIAVVQVTRGSGDADVPEPPTTTVVAEPVTTPEPVEPELVYPDLGPPLSTTKFTISTSPIGAAVFMGTESLGRTPVVLRGDRVDGSEVALRVELEGYHSAEVTTPLVDGGRVDLDLQSTAVAGPDAGGAAGGGTPTDRLIEMIKMSDQLHHNGAFPNEPARP